MHNNVVIAIQRHFRNKGYVTVCLNFRGCGNSKGRTSWTAMPERADYASVVRYLLESEVYRTSGYPKINQLILCVKKKDIFVYCLFGLLTLIHRNAGLFIRSNDSKFDLSTIQYSKC
jgi:hypothetical protein